TLSADGRRLAFWVCENWRSAVEVHVWETATWSEAYRFTPPDRASAFAFTPDGRRLVVGHDDTTLSIWDRAKVERGLLGNAGNGRDGLWQQLASFDARIGLAAVYAFVDSPEAALPLLRAHFQPVDPGKLTALVADLGDDDYATRESAEKELAAF